MINLNDIAHNGFNVAKTNADIDRKNQAMNKINLHAKIIAECVVDNKINFDELSDVLKSQLFKQFMLEIGNLSESSRILNVNRLTFRKWGKIGWTEQ